MAEQVQEKRKGGGIIKVLLVFLIILILLVGGFIALIKFDVASLGTQVIGPRIQNMPGASLILPEMPQETIDGEGDGAQAYESIDQVVEILKVTENLLKEKEQEAETLNEQIAQLEEENKRLQVFEENYTSFEEDKKAFDNLIVDKTDPEAFSKWYESMNPENAATIYSQVVQEQALSQELDNLVLTYQNMKPAAAAAILEEMSTTRLEMVASIIQNLEQEQAGKILGAMDTTIAARITAYLYPEQS